MTPTAAQGFMRCLYSHKEIEYNIEKIVILNPIIYQNMGQIELNGNESMNKKTNRIERIINLRNSQTLVNPAYVIVSEMTVKPEYADTENIVKHFSILERRIENEQSYSLPYLGLREYVCDFDFPSQDDKPREDINMDLGFMIHSWTPDKKPLFFNAKIEKGCMEIPTRG
jgi:CRISPR-associated protein Cas5d